MRSLISSLLIITGILSVSFAIFLNFQRTNPNRLNFENFTSDQQVVNVDNKKAPVGIIIDKINVTLPLIAAHISDNKWPATDQGVSYLDSAPIPGEQGNSILYGHNWNSILGKLPNLKPGDEIKILFSDNSELIYVVKYTQIVEPTQISILNNTKDPRITLYTCTGFLDSKRFVVTAFPSTL